MQRLTRDDGLVGSYQACLAAVVCVPVVGLTLGDFRLDPTDQAQGDRCLGRDNRGVTDKISYDGIASSITPACRGCDIELEIWRYLSNRERHIDRKGNLGSLANSEEVELIFGIC